MICSGSLSGHFDLRVYDATTGALVKLRSFDNLITDQGLAGYCGGPVSFRNTNFVVVGNGTNVPEPTDTILGNQLASAPMGANWSGGIGSAPDYISWARNTARFEAGTFNGTTLTEVGITAYYSKNKVFSRALILDNNGQPSAIVVLPNEYLDVSYTLQYHPDKSDVQFQFVMNQVTYSCTARCALVNTAAYPNGVAIPLVSGGLGVYSVYNTQTLGAIESEPVYSSGGIKTYRYAGTYLPYSTETPYSVKYTCNLPLSAGNFSGGIGSMLVGPPSGDNSGIKSYTQISFDPKLPKNANTEMTFTLVKTVSRYVAPTS